MSECIKLESSKIIIFDSIVESINRRYEAANNEEFDNGKEIAQKDN
jgi:hypothetical protein